MREAIFNSKDTLRCRDCKETIGQRFLYEDLKLISAKDNQVLAYLQKSQNQRKPYIFDFIAYKQNEIIGYCDKKGNKREGMITYYHTTQG